MQQVSTAPCAYGSPVACSTEPNAPLLRRSAAAMLRQIRSKASRYAGEPVMAASSARAMIGCRLSHRDEGSSKNSRPASVPSR